MHLTFVIFCKKNTNKFYLWLCTTNEFFERLKFRLFICCPKIETHQTSRKRKKKMKRERASSINENEENNNKKQKLEEISNQDKIISILNDETAICNYFPDFLSINMANNYYKLLRDNIPWKMEQVVVFGKTHQLSRKTCAFGEANTSYRYSGTQKDAISFDSCPVLIEIKQLVEQKLSKNFNFALLNFYADGKVSIGPHSDDEHDLEQDHIIASVSLGAERDFVITGKKSNYSRQICLKNGSLLTMGGKMQQNYKHAVPKRSKVIQGRINITFRSVKSK